ncbi:hypothetical protein PHLCEN_2v10582 [Hermanssonia centrifuga]|uniref:DUF2423 domain-containing protein n=1 Tax=Hermanssonia centrifuga TaxID=98765 RepID=A0A2R6NMP5_9APHY|nr:hypothetical protein PHLCEN_2v10582 [Hermanssonia centrifuga]
MGKSTRSKVKRHFRAQKREHGVYAAVEAARLNRLHQKLKIISTKANEAEEVDEIDEEKMRGWYWLSSLGLLDLADVTAERLGELFGGRCTAGVTSGADARNCGRQEEDYTMLNHLFGNHEVNDGC